jgi:hypothetical protein
MEAAPRAKTNESVESADRWRELKEQAPEEAKQLMVEVFGGREESVIPAVERVEILTGLLETLGNDNKHRYVAEVIAGELKAAHIKLSFEQSMSQLTSPAERKAA